MGPCLWKLSATKTLHLESVGGHLVAFKTTKHADSCTIAVIWIMLVCANSIDAGKASQLFSWGGSHRISLPTLLTIPSDTSMETSALRPHLIAIYRQLLWFQIEEGKKKTVSTSNYGDQTLQPFSATTAYFCCFQLTASRLETSLWVHLESVSKFFLLHISGQNYPCSLAQTS